MNKKVIRLLILLVLASAVLTGCATGVRAESTPGVTVTDNYVYLAYMNNLYQLDRMSGARISSFPEKASAGLAMYAAPITDNGFVYFGDLGNDFHKVSEANLNQIVWTFDLAKGWYQAKPAMDGHLVIVPCTDRNIYAIDKETGTEAWVYRGEYAFIAQPVVVEDRVIVSAQDHHVLVLDIASGEELYRVEMKGAVLAPPLYDPESGSVFVGSLGREMVSFDLANGEINWTYSTDDLSTIWATPILLDNQLIFTDKNGKIIALNPATGEDLWQNNAGGTVIAGVTLVGDQGFPVAREDGTMSYYSSESKGGDWTVTVPGNIYSKPIVDGDQIFVPVVKADAYIYTYNITGVPGWSFNPSN
ncbi:MAG TPA: hypothetical protein DCM45_00765 [Clostridiales bacterium]|nr:hypothetical protein [Clostridiales bacterium]